MLEVLYVVVEYEMTVLWQIKELIALVLNCLLIVLKYDIYHSITAELVL